MSYAPTGGGYRLCAVSTTPYSSQDSDAAAPPIVRRNTVAGARVIEVGGKLDLDTLPPLRQALEAAADAQPTTVLDLSDVTFADSSALNLLLLFSQSTDLRLAAPSGGSSASPEQNRSCACTPAWRKPPAPERKGEAPVPRHAPYPR